MNYKTTPIEKLTKEREMISESIPIKAYDGRFNRRCRVGTNGQSAIFVAEDEDGHYWLVLDGNRHANAYYPQSVVFIEEKENDN